MVLLPAWGIERIPVLSSPLWWWGWGVGVVVWVVGGGVVVC